MGVASLAARVAAAGVRVTTTARGVAVTAYSTATAGGSLAQAVRASRVTASQTQTRNGWVNMGRSFLSQPECWFQDKGAGSPAEFRKVTGRLRRPVGAAVEPGVEGNAGDTAGGKLEEIDFVVAVTEGVEGQPLAVGREAGRAIGDVVVGEQLGRVAGKCEAVQIVVAVAVGGKDERVAVGGPGGVEVFGGVIGQAFDG